MICNIKDVVDFYDEYPEFIGELLVDTRFGYKTIEYADTTAFDSDILEIVTDSGRMIKTSPDHRLFDINNGWTYSKHLSTDSILLCKNSEERVVSVKLLDYKDDLYDIQVEDVHEFYANGIVSHNSAMWDALVFGLYGVPYRKINKGNLVNSINKKNLLVEVEFSVNGSDYLVKRGIKPNIFEIYENGELLEVSASVKDYQKILEESILRINHKSFCQVVIQGSANAIPFMQLTAAHRREVVEDLLDLQVFSIMNAEIKDKASTLKSKKTDLEYEIKFLKEKIEILRKTNATMIDDVKDQIEVKTSSLQKLENDVLERNKLISSLEEDLKILEDGLPDVTRLEAKKEKLYNIRSKFTSTLSTLKCDLDFFHDNQSCPTCRQAIDDAFRKNKVEEIQSSNEQASIGLSEVENALSSLNEDIKVAKERNSAYKTKKQEIQFERNNLSSLDRQIKSIETEITNLQKKLEEKIENADTTEIEGELQNKNFEFVEITEELEVITLALAILKDNGIKAKVLETYVPIINSLINHYLTQMEFYVNFELDQNFEEKITSLSKEDFTYMNFSEGEKSRIDTAILLAWRTIAKQRNSAYTNLLVLDEVLDSSLDSHGIDSLMCLLKSLDHNMNLFVITHRFDMYEDYFDSVISFEKTNNFTQLRE